MGWWNPFNAIVDAANAVADAIVDAANAVVDTFKDLTDFLKGLFTSVVTDAQESALIVSDSGERANVYISNASLSKLYAATALSVSLLQKIAAERAAAEAAAAAAEAAAAAAAAVEAEAKSEQYINEIEGYNNHAKNLKNVAEQEDSDRSSLSSTSATILGQFTSQTNAIINAKTNASSNALALSSSEKLINTTLSRGYVTSNLSSIITAINSGDLDTALTSFSLLSNAKDDTIKFKDETITEAASEVNNVSFWKNKAIQSNYYLNTDVSSLRYLSNDDENLKANINAIQSETQSLISSAESAAEAASNFSNEKLTAAIALLTNIAGQITNITVEKQKVDGYVPNINTATGAAFIYRPDEYRITSELSNINAAEDTWTNNITSTEFKGEGSIAQQSTKPANITEGIALTYAEEEAHRPEPTEPYVPEEDAPSQIMLRTQTAILEGKTECQKGINDRAASVESAGTAMNNSQTSVTAAASAETNAATANTNANEKKEEIEALRSIENATNTAAKTAINNNNAVIADLANKTYASDPTTLYNQVNNEIPNINSIIAEF